MTAFLPTPEYPQGLFMGLDVGSTTAKFVVVDPASNSVLLKDYRRHETRRPETCLDMQRAIGARFPDVPAAAMRVFVTGSGGTAVGRHLGAKFVQEVNAVSLAVEKLYPDAHSVIELAAGREDHRLQKGRGGGTQAKDPVDERLVRWRHRRRHRQDQRQAARSRRAAGRRRLPRAQAPSSGGQVRRVRGNGYQWPTEARGPRR